MFPGEKICLEQFVSSVTPAIKFLSELTKVRQRNNYFSETETFPLTRSWFFFQLKAFEKKLASCMSFQCDFTQQVPQTKVRHRWSKQYFSSAVSFCFSADFPHWKNVASNLFPLQLQPNDGCSNERSSCLGWWQNISAFEDVCFQAKQLPACVNSPHEAITPR